jgi:hypothetical protein
MSESPRDEFIRRQTERLPRKWYWLRQRDPVARYTLYLAISTLALFLATVGLIVAGILQWSSLKAQLAEAVTNREHAEADERLDKRAWIGLKSAIGVPGSFTATSPWQVNFTFTNSGKTPARKLEIAAITLHSPVPVDGPTAEFAKIMRTKFVRGRAIAPQQDYTYGINTPLTWLPITEAESIQRQPEIVALYPFIMSGQQFLYYFGELRYQDVYGADHFTDFCIYMADPRTQGLAFCKDFNDLN